MNREKPRPQVGVAVIVKKDNMILLGKRKTSHGTGAWAPPGGHLEFGEEVEECARRELLEETGLEAVSLLLGPWTNTIFDSTKHYITLFVFVDHFEGTLQLMEPEKCEGWHWFDQHSLPTPLFSPLQSFLSMTGEVL